MSIVDWSENFPIANHTRAHVNQDVENFLGSAFMRFVHFWDIVIEVFGDSGFAENR